MTDHPAQKGNVVLSLHFEPGADSEFKAHAHRRSLIIMHEEQAESTRRIKQRMLAEFPTVELRQEQA